jgi:hypothetical protein
MYRCLCASIIITVIILIGVLSELGKYIDENGNVKLTNQHLRGISTISNLLYIEGIIDDRFNKIHNGVIESAIKGKTNVDFTIMCIRNQYNMCDNYDGYQQWWRRYIATNGGEQLPNNNNQSEQIKMRVIEKIQSAFPESNITKGYKNCCDIYNITW